MMCVILGVQPDVPTEINENGGRQSATPYAFHFLPPHALFAAAEVAKYGAEKYGETLLNRNYKKIPPEILNGCDFIMPTAGWDDTVKMASSAPYAAYISSSRSGWNTGISLISVPS